MGAAQGGGGDGDERGLVPLALGVLHHHHAGQAYNRSLLLCPSPYPELTCPDLSCAMHSIRGTRRRAAPRPASSCSSTSRAPRWSARRRYAGTFRQPFLGTTHVTTVQVRTDGAWMWRCQASGQQLEEAKTINKSLSALGLVSRSPLLTAQSWRSRAERHWAAPCSACAWSVR